MALLLQVVKGDEERKQRQALNIFEKDGQHRGFSPQTQRSFARPACEGTGEVATSEPEGVARKKRAIDR